MPPADRQRTPRWLAPVLLLISAAAELAALGLLLLPGSPAVLATSHIEATPWAVIPSPPASHSALAAASRPTATPAPEPAGAPPLPQPDDLNVLLLGRDAFSGDSSWRTDAIIVVAIRPRAGFVAMLSIPRDLWVDIPGYGMQRINVADYRGEVTGWPSGGPGLVGDTLWHNLGIPVHAYVRVDSQGLVRIIDALGGISFDVTRPLTDPTMEDLHFEAGVQHMDGARALLYARSRTTTNDLDRTRRQQQILLAIRDAALRPAMLPRLLQLIPALADTVDTDLSRAQVLSLVDLARGLPASAYRTRTFDATMVRDWVTPGGAMVLLYDRGRIEEAWGELTRVDAPAH